VALLSRRRSPPRGVRTQPAATTEPKKRTEAARIEMEREAEI